MKKTILSIDENIKQLCITKAEYARRLSKQGKPVKPQYLNQMLRDGWIVVDAQLYRPTGYFYNTPA